MNLLLKTLEEEPALNLEMLEKEFTELWPVLQAVDPYNFISLFDSHLGFPENKEQLAAIYLLGYIRALISVEKSKAFYALEAWQEAKDHLAYYI